MLDPDLRDRVTSALDRMDQLIKDADFILGVTDPDDEARLAAILEGSA